jgi:hypothetical protein
VTARRRILISLLLFLIGAAVSIAYIYFEAAARIAIGIRDQDMLYDAQQIWAETYGAAPYYSRPFLDEVKEVSGVFDVSSDGLKIAKDLHGQYINIVDLKRFTDFQPTHVDHIIYMIGDSALFSSNVPDEYTIASQLQHRLNKNHSVSYKVINLGIPTLNSGGALTLLKSLTLRKGDHVIFYSALSDTQGVYEDVVRKRREDIPQKVCTWLRQNIDHMALGKMYCIWIEETFPPEIDGSQNWHAKIGSAAAKYHDNVIAAQQYSESAGASFYTFLAPHLWTAPLSDFENRIARNAILGDYGGGQVFGSFWPHLEMVHDELRQKGTQAYNLSHILDYARMRKQQKFFFDCCHVNAAGNALVADAIYNLIVPF